MRSYFGHLAAAHFTLCTSQMRQMSSHGATSDRQDQILEFIFISETTAYMAGSNL